MTEEKARFVDFTTVSLQDTFWKPRLDTNRAVTIPHNLAKCEEVGAIDNFAKAGGLMEGDYVGLPNWDPIVYKAVEAASYALKESYDAELDRRLDAIIEKVAAAQEEDGYLCTWKTIARRRSPDAQPPWSDLQGDLELYRAGHLFEAAAAHYEATGKRSLLDVAVKNADLIDRTFGPGKRMGVPGHEEIEPALVRLYEVTGNENYLHLSQFFIDQRGNEEGHELYGAFHQDHKPFVEQSEAVGQAPRATYLYAGAADVARHIDRPDYLTALERLWHDVIFRKMYVTGGIGSLHENEGFGPPYELPNLTAYTEICAAISFPMWASRMFQLTGEGAYFDVIERTLYNNLAAGVSLSGDRYFYACPPESDGEYKFNLGWCPEGTELPYDEPSATRKEWFPCACCPPNIARYLFRVPAFLYAVGENGIYVNLFAQSEAILAVNGTRVRLKQTTDYPWSGDVTIDVHPSEEKPFTLRIRIPGWAREEPVPSDLYRYLERSDEQVTLAVNGEQTDVELEKGYARLDRTWAKGDVVQISFPMSIRRVVAHPNVEEDRGKVSLERGPIVFCAEGVDNDGTALDTVLPDGAELSYEYRDDLLGGVGVVEGEAYKLRENRMIKAPFTAIPYCVWSNRGVNEMAVWLRRKGGD